MGNDELINKLINYFASFNELKDEIDEQLNEMDEQLFVELQVQ
jgi:hypothetical protein